ncbi:DsrE family protein [Pollutibacter soli]|uniref:DsrE family protein n=1 Tax=Pollutibacter soli TaxID=3034157 RepID=UPI00301363E4
MKKISFVLVILLTAYATNAQTKKHRIIFDMAKTDTGYQAILMKQLNNTLNEAPDAELEVVCYGPGLSMLVKGRNSVESQMKALTERGKVSFVACANAMKIQNVKKEDLIPFVLVTPVALLELSSKQMEGWSYVKAGF